MSSAMEGRKRIGQMESKKKESGFFSGELLSELVEKEGKISPEQVFAWMEPVIGQLAREHEEGRVHGGITPDTVMVYERLWYCFLLPDGVGEISSASGGGARGFLTMPRTEEDGGQNWDALEAQMNHSAAGPWSDVYSLCAVMYYAVTGRPPETRQTV